MNAIFENRNKSKEESVYINTQESLNFYAHWHPEIELLYVAQGCIKVGVNGEERILKENQISICSSNAIHYYNSDKIDSKSIILIFKEDIIKTNILWSKYVKPSSGFLDLHSLEDKGRQITCTLQNIIAENKSKQTLSKEFTNLNICSLFFLIFRNFPNYYALSTSNTGDISIDKSPMQKALKYLEGNYYKNISLKNISDYVNLSEYHFSRIFKKTTGINFHFYLSYLRVQSAKKLIKTTDKKIIDIAYECGFNSIRTFNRNFKQFCDITPCEFKKYN